MRVRFAQLIVTLDKALSEGECLPGGRLYPSEGLKWACHLWWQALLRSLLRKEVSSMSRIPSDKILQDYSPAG